MAIKCGNCGGHFTTDELANRRRPLHPWPLTASGLRALAANQQRPGNHLPCPDCGQQTLLL